MNWKQQSRVNTNPLQSRGRLRIAIVCVVVAITVAMVLWLVLPKAEEESQHATVSQLDSHRGQPHTQAASVPGIDQNGQAAAGASLPFRWDESMCDATLSAAKTGIGWVALQARLAWEARKAESDVKEVLERAAKSVVPLERATALHLQAEAKTNETRSLLSKQFSTCRPGQACAKEFETAIAVATLPERDAIAQLAMSSNDPQLYALAYRTCKQRVDGFCQHISAAQWAQRDPANGTAWQYVAREAKAAQQNQAFEDALYKLSISTQFQNGNAALGATIDALSAQTESQLSRIRLNLQSMGSIAEGADYLFVADYCKGDALQNPNRQQVCDGIANTLIQNGDSLFARATGLGIGSNLHWAPERIATLRDEQDALLGMRASNLFGTASGATTDSDQLAQCRGLMRALNKARNLRLGEIGSLKAQIAEQPESLSSLARRYRDSQKSGIVVAP